MTTHTDRKSADILAALDKLAENGMPFVDVVKADVERNYIATFSNPPFSISGTGAKPLPTAPVQVHEDPGAAYWKEATKMAEHTDRIKQMAQEAGFGIGHSEAAATLFAKFAALVAEDCARIADESEPRRGVGDEIRYYYSPTIATPSQAG